MIALEKVQVHVQVLPQRYLGYSPMHSYKTQAYPTLVVLLCHTFFDHFIFLDCIMRLFSHPYFCRRADGT